MYAQYSEAGRQWLADSNLTGVAFYVDAGYVHRFDPATGQYVRAEPAPAPFVNPQAER